MSSFASTASKPPFNWVSSEWMCSRQMTLPLRQSPTEARPAPNNAPFLSACCQTPPNSAPTGHVIPSTPPAPVSPTPTTTSPTTILLEWRHRAGAQFAPNWPRPTDRKGCRLSKSGASIPPRPTQHQCSSCGAESAPALHKPTLAPTLPALGCPGNMSVKTLTAASTS